jgi:hypothetical protein
MAVKRGRKKSKTKSAADAYEQTMLAEGAPLALDLLGLGSTISDLVTGKSRKAAKKKPAKKKRAKKKTRAKVGRPATRKKRAKVGRPPLRRTKKKSARKARRKSRRA